MADSQYTKMSFPIFFCVEKEESKVGRHTSKEKQATTTTTTYSTMEGREIMPSSGPSKVVHAENPMEVKEDCCGWLWKKGGLLKKWKNRFFSLRGAILTYYTDFPADEYLAEAALRNSSSSMQYVPPLGETKPCGVLRVAHVEPATDSNLKLRVYGVSGKILELSCDTPATCARWVNALVFAARLGRRKDLGTGSFVSTSSDSCSTIASMASLTEEELERMSNFVDQFGWLRTKVRGRWRHKFFVLQGSMLSNHDDDLPWTVPNTRAYVTGVLKATNSGTGLLISLSVGEKVLVHAESKEDRDQWYHSLKINLVCQEVEGNSNSRPDLGTTVEESSAFMSLSRQ